MSYNVVRHMMTIKSVDGYSTNHDDGHEWPRWNL